MSCADLSMPSNWPGWRWPSPSVVDGAFGPLMGGQEAALSIFEETFAPSRAAAWAPNYQLGHFSNLNQADEIQNPQLFPRDDGRLQNPLTIREEVKMTRIRGFLSSESFEPAVACMLFGIKGSFQISHGWIERSQFWVENKFLTLFSPLN